MIFVNFGGEYVFVARDIVTPSNRTSTFRRNLVPSKNFGIRLPSDTATYNRTYEGRTESHEQHCFACELGTADEGECGGRWNQLLCYP